MRTVEALQHHPLVMNAYNTGTGKTVASLLYLFTLEPGRHEHVLFMAPTNELLHQHYVDIRRFVETHNLPFRVVELNAARLQALGAESDDLVDRGGERLVRLTRNPLEFYKELEIQLSDQRPLPLILVTNPDLFYYAFFWQFAAADQRNLFESFIKRFRYIVIDEFHYYNRKQLANFLFFMILSKEWGYFADGYRRLCLLSATPDRSTRTYLDRVFGAEGWALVSPDNEPREAAQLEAVSVLAPLTLYVRSSTVDSYAADEADAVRAWLTANQHGALISNALWRINQAYYTLRTRIPQEKIGRITGAQPIAERRRDQFKELILATPTVDIGYNFEKIDKPRQNLDFVVFDARFHDEYIQRLGRAGRILGKPETNIPSWAVALVNQDAVTALQQWHGQELSREAFANLLRTTSALPEKDDFSAYVKSGGLLENAYPLYRLREIFPGWSGRTWRCYSRA